MIKLSENDKSWINGYLDGRESGQKQAFFEMKEYINEKIKDKSKSINNKAKNR